MRHKSTDSMGLFFCRHGIYSFTISMTDFTISNLFKLFHPPNIFSVVQRWLKMKSPLFLMAKIQVSHKYLYLFHTLRYISTRILNTLNKNIFLHISFSFYVKEYFAVFRSGNKTHLYNIHVYIL